MGDVRQHQQSVGVEALGEQRRRQVLVDDRLHAFEAAATPYHKDSTAPATGDGRTGVDESRDRLELDDLLGLGRRDDPAEVAPVRGDAPTRVADPGSDPVGPGRLEADEVAKGAACGSIAPRPVKTSETIDAGPASPARTAGSVKMPEPTMLPTTSAVAIQRPIDRFSRGLATSERLVDSVRLGQPGFLPSQQGSAFGLIRYDECSIGSWRVSRRLRGAWISSVPCL
jgi:hypothetical protein